MTVRAIPAPHGRAILVRGATGATLAHIKTGRRRRVRASDRRAALALVRAIADAHDLTGGMYR